MPTWANRPSRIVAVLRPRPIGQSLRRRLAADDRRAGGRPAATPREWAVIRTAVILRARYRCQACGTRGPLDVHHLVKRAQGGSDFDLDRLMALCRRCHAWTDAPYRQGRLVITPHCDGTASFARVWRASKWAPAEIRTPWPPAALENRRMPDTRDRVNADGLRYDLGHGPEELVLHYPATLGAATARRVVAGVLDNGRVSPPRPA